jgi:hypothetical protein
MAAAPPAPAPTVSPAEIQFLVSRAGLVLNPGQVADLVLAWRQVAGLIASLPQQRPLADDMALVFRLPPPEAASTSPSRLPAKRAADASPPRLKAALTPPRTPARMTRAAAKASTGATAGAKPAKGRRV